MELEGVKGVKPLLCSYVLFSCDYEVVFEELMELWSYGVKPLLCSYVSSLWDYRNMIVKFIV